MRYDQWLVVEPLLANYFDVKTDLYYSILPSATPYARNALFAGLFPYDIQKAYPKIWSRGQVDPGSHNRYEHELLDHQLARLNIDLKTDSKYIKVLDPEEGESLKEQVSSEFNCAELWLTEFSPVMGYATGTGTVGLAFYKED